MKVFLLRHAEAAYGVADPVRPLTENGRQMAAGLAGFISGNPWFRYAEIWSSPYLRARQTAEPFIERNGRSRELITMEDLVPHGDPDVLSECLAKSRKPVLVVGHNPHLTRVARRLMGLDRRSGSLHFKKCCLFAFQRESSSPTRFTLAACLPPGSVGLKG